MKAAMNRIRQTACDTFTVTFPDGDQYRFLGQVKRTLWHRFLDLVTFWKKERRYSIKILGDREYLAADNAPKSP